MPTLSAALGERKERKENISSAPAVCRKLHIHYLISSARQRSPERFYDNFWREEEVGPEKLSNLLEATQLASLRA